MIQISRKEYPNPVLANGRDDYQEQYNYSFLINMDEVLVSKENIEIPVSYELNCPSLEQMINDGELKSIVKVKSSEASFCRIYEFPLAEKNMTVEIPKFDVISKIELTGMIIASKKLEKFVCPEFNNIYFEGSTFDLRKGDVLATDLTRVIYVDDSELEKPIASIFTINKISNQEEDIIADFSEEKININMSEDLNKMYWTLKDFNNGALRRYVGAIVVYPVLVEAIDIIKAHYAESEDEDYSEKRWFRAIELKVLTKCKIKMENCTESSTMIADKLLGNITLDALRSFKDTLDQEVNNGELQNLGGID